MVKMLAGRPKSGKTGLVKPAERPSPVDDDGIEGTIWTIPYSEDAFVSIQRRDELEQKWVTHGRLSPQDAEPESVANRFGGGNYRVQLKDKNERGQFVQTQQHIYKVPGVYRPPERLPGLGPEPVRLAPEGPGASPIESAGNQMRMLDAALVGTVVDLLKTAREGGKASGVDPALAAILEGMREDRNILVRLIEKVVDKPAAPPPDTFTLLKQLKELMPPPAPAPAPVTPTNQLKDIVEAIQTLKGAAQEFEPDRGDPLLDTVRPMVEVIYGEYQEKQRRAGRPALPAGPTGTPVLASGRVPDPALAALPLWHRVVLREGPKLLAQAQAGQDADFIAETAVRFMPATIKGAMEEFFSREDAEAALVAAYPPLGEFPKWVNKFVTTVKELLGPEEPEGGDDAEETEHESE